VVTLKPGWRRRRNRKDNWKRKIELTGGIVRPKSAGGSEEGGSDGSWKKNDQGEVCRWRNEKEREKTE
jgi:hypothetical protein